MTDTTREASASLEKRAAALEIVSREIGEFGFVKVGHFGAQRQS